MKFLKILQSKVQSMRDNAAGMIVRTRESVSEQGKRSVRELLRHLISTKDRATPQENKSNKAKMSEQRDMK